jgi:hypothetical protein
MNTNKEHVMRFTKSELALVMRCVRKQERAARDDGDVLLEAECDNLAARAERVLLGVYKHATVRVFK